MSRAACGPRSGAPKRSSPEPTSSLPTPTPSEKDHPPSDTTSAPAQTRVWLFEAPRLRTIYLSGFNTLTGNPDYIFLEGDRAFGILQLQDHINARATVL